VSNFVCWRLVVDCEYRILRCWIEVDNNVCIVLIVLFWRKYICCLESQIAVDITYTECFHYSWMRTDLCSNEPDSLTQNGNIKTCIWLFLRVSGTDCLNNRIWFRKLALDLLKLNNGHKSRYKCKECIVGSDTSYVICFCSKSNVYRDSWTRIDLCSNERILLIATALFRAVC